MSGWSVTASTITVPQIIIGEHIVRTDAQSGALVTVPVAAPVEQPPAPAIDIPAVLQALLDAEIEIAGLNIMPLRSLFSVLAGRVAAAEAGISDISGVRIPAIVTEQLSNASLDAAREVAQALLDASQDAAAAQAALEAATASGSIAAVAGRVDVLEAAAPSYAAAADLSALDGRVAVLEAVPGFDDTALVASVAAVASDLSAVDARVVVLEGHDVYVESVVSAAIAVGVADAATALSAAGSAAADAALADAKAVQAQSTADQAVLDAAAAASAAAAAQSTADAAAAAAATKEEAGLRPAVQVHYYDTEVAGAEEASQGFPQATAGAAAALGKLVVVKTAGANTTRNAVTLPAGTPAAGDKRSFLNVGVDALAIKDSAGSVIAELMAGEGQSLIYVNGGWVLEAGF
jgi:trimeric autotransporter adhesin